MNHPTARRSRFGQANDVHHAMKDSEALESIGPTDPRDAGCDQVMAALHIYVELATAGRDPAETHPGIAAHLTACGPCGEDFTGLLAAVTGGSSGYRR